MDNYRRIRAAKGEEKCDLVIKNAKICDILCHRIYEGDMGIADGVIVGTGKYEGDTEIDAKGAYVMPSFVESHVHVESSMLTVGEFAKLEAAWGVTEVIADPHEIANVSGEDGLKYMLDSAKGLPINIHFMLPSCVPATPFDSPGAVIDAPLTHELMKKYGFYGLGEMMNYPGLLAGDSDVIDKLSAASITDGHSPSLSGMDLNAYLAAGIKTDHECVTASEAEEKISKGMYVMLREGSQSKDIEKLYTAINPHTLRRVLFCTDDRHLDDVIEGGTIANCIRRAEELGVDFLDALTIACLNPTECYNLGRRGIIAPSYAADIVIAEDKELRNIKYVLKDGKVIAKDGSALFETKNADNSKVVGTVHLKTMTPDDFKLDFTPGMAVIEAVERTLVTKRANPESSEGLNLCAVIERHHGTGRIGKCFIKGFDLKGGAIAQSVGHDSHNITVVGDSGESMAAAVNALGKDGGMSVVSGGEVIAFMPLEISGVMTEKTASEANAEYKKLKAAASRLDMNQKIQPFMLLSFLSLLVIPSLKISDRGLFDVDNFTFLK